MHLINILKIQVLKTVQVIVWMIITIIVMMKHINIFIILIHQIYVLEKNMSIFIILMNNNKEYLYKLVLINILLLILMQNHINV